MAPPEALSMPPKLIPSRPAGTAPPSTRTLFSFVAKARLWPLSVSAPDLELTLRAVSSASARTPRLRSAEAPMQKSVGERRVDPLRSVP